MSVKLRSCGCGWRWLRFWSCTASEEGGGCDKNDVVLTEVVLERRWIRTTSFSVCNRYCHKVSRLLYEVDLQTQMAVGHKPKTMVLSSLPYSGLTKSMLSTAHASNFHFFGWFHFCSSDVHDFGDCNFFNLTQFLNMVNKCVCTV